MARLNDCKAFANNSDWLLAVSTNAWQDDSAMTRKRGLATHLQTQYSLNPSSTVFAEKKPHVRPICTLRLPAIEESLWNLITKHDSYAAGFLAWGSRADIATAAVDALSGESGSLSGAQGFEWLVRGYGGSYKGIVIPDGWHDNPYRTLLVLH